MTTKHPQFRDPEQIQSHWSHSPRLNSLQDFLFIDFIFVLFCNYSGTSIYGRLRQ